MHSHICIYTHPVGTVLYFTPLTHERGGGGGLVQVIIINPVCEHAGPWGLIEYVPRNWHILTYCRVEYIYYILGGWVGILYSTPLYSTLLYSTLLYTGACQWSRSDHLRGNGSRLPRLLLLAWSGIFEVSMQGRYSIVDSSNKQGVGR